MKSRFLTLFVIGTALIAFGCSQEEAVVSPEPAQDEAESAAKLVITKARAGGQWNSTRPVQVFPTIDAATPAAGSARVIRTPRGMTATLRSSGLSAGTAVSLWWVVFNNPKKCATTPCTAADLKNPEVMPDMLGNPGQVIGQDGNANLTGQISIGNTDHSYINQNFGMTPVGLMNP
ncbi:MAG: hypothetical protein HYW07_22825, partial [Candidatus Latescibacteria bacterium]|nr:hypothetical protein [Candidatus Latescibacterota bacterium]